MIRLTRAQVWAIIYRIDEVERNVSDFLYEMWQNMDEDEKIELSLKKVLDS